jgi:hypothetical protein
VRYGKILQAASDVVLFSLVNTCLMSLTAPGNLFAGIPRAGQPGIELNA